MRERKLYPCVGGRSRAGARRWIGEAVSPHPERPVWGTPHLRGKTTSFPRIRGAVPSDHRRSRPYSASPSRTGSGMRNLLRFQRGYSFIPTDGRGRAACLTACGVRYFFLRMRKRISISRKSCRVQPEKPGAGDDQPEGHEGVEDPGEEEADDPMRLVGEIEAGGLAADPCQPEEGAEDQPLQEQVAEKVEGDGGGKPSRKAD